MNSSDPAGTKYRVICVCGGYGFPLGTASAARIIMVGKALQEADIGFRVLHCGPSPSPSISRDRVFTKVYRSNTLRGLGGQKQVRSTSGIRMGSRWSYGSPCTTLARSPFYAHLSVCHGWCVESLCWSSVPTARSPVVQEFCEWFPDAAELSRFQSMALQETNF